MFRIAFGALPFLLPLMLQLGFGASALESGAITFASAAGSIFVKAAARPVLQRFGYRRLLVANGLICAVYFVTCGFFRPDWPVALLYAILFVGGTFRSLTYTAYGTLCYADIPPPRMGAAVAFHSIIQQFSVTLGVAISALILAVAMFGGGHEQPTVDDFTVTTLTMGLLIIAGVPICRRLARSAGVELSGHRAENERIAREGAAADVAT
jgi:MFS family permease